MIRQFKFIGLTTFFCCFSPAWVAASCDMDMFPIMAEMRTYQLMDEANYNGEMMSVKGFHADISAAELRRYYERQWSGREAHSVLGQWQQISTMTRRCILTVQYQSSGAGKTTGRLIASKPPESRLQNMGKGVPIPEGGIVISDLETEDGPKSGRLVMISSGQSAVDILDFYHAEMQGTRWLLERKFEEQGAFVLLFRDGVDEFNLVIIPTGNGMSQILINKVRLK
jgi:hypothetical protein